MAPACTGWMRPIVRHAPTISFAGVCLVACLLQGCGGRTWRGRVAAAGTMAVLFGNPWSDSVMVFSMCPLASHQRCLRPWPLAAGYWMQWPTAMRGANLLQRIPPASAPKLGSHHGQRRGHRERHAEECGPPPPVLQICSTTLWASVPLRFCLLRCVAVTSICSAATDLVLAKPLDSQGMIIGCLEMLGGAWPDGSRQLMRSKRIYTYAPCPLAAEEVALVKFQPGLVKGVGSTVALVTGLVRLHDVWLILRYMDCKVLHGTLVG
mmetsp:Transcript_57723/g.115645  ORF Transcript_57723/g.115645 Transcript_57723/m.115645 type:complete len:265 (+) Transcript_57723:3-797(+)